MTMKTKHILLGLSLGLLGGFTACDVTDLNPKDSITDNSYWNTVSDLENYAKGFYMNLTGKGLRADGSENLDDLNTLDDPNNEWKEITLYTLNDSGESVPVKLYYGIEYLEEIFYKEGIK